MAFKPTVGHASRLTDGSIILPIPTGKRSKRKTGLKEIENAFWCDAELGKQKIEPACRKKAAFYRAHKEEFREKRKLYRYKDYGITLELFNFMLEKQNGVCAICKNAFKRPYIDHDHKCRPGGKSCGRCVRGILCFSCNTFLGHAKDNKETLRAAIAYLTMQKEESNA